MPIHEVRGSRSRREPLRSPFSAWRPGTPGRTPLLVAVRARSGPTGRDTPSTATGRQAIVFVKIPEGEFLMGTRRGDVKAFIDAAVAKWGHGVLMSEETQYDQVPPHGGSESFSSGENRADSIAVGACHETE